MEIVSLVLTKASNSCEEDTKHWPKVFGTALFKRQLPNVSQYKA